MTLADLMAFASKITDRLFADGLVHPHADRRLVVKTVAEELGEIMGVAVDLTRMMLEATE